MVRVGKYIDSEIPEYECYFAGSADCRETYYYMDESFDYDVIQTIIIDPSEYPVRDSEQGGKNGR